MGKLPLYIILSILLLGICYAADVFDNPDYYNDVLYEHSPFAFKNFSSTKIQFSSYGITANISFYVENPAGNIMPVQSVNGLKLEAFQYEQSGRNIIKFGHKLQVPNTNFRVFYNVSCSVPIVDDYCGKMLMDFSDPTVEQEEYTDEEGKLFKKQAYEKVTEKGSRHQTHYYTPNAEYDLRNGDWANIDPTFTYSASSNTAVLLNASLRQSTQVIVVSQINQTGLTSYYSFDADKFDTITPRQNGSLFFDGDTDYVAIVNSSRNPSYNLTGMNFTFAAWINPNTANTLAIVSKGNNNAVGSIVLFMGASRQISFRLSNSTGLTTLQTANNVIPLNSWTLVVGRVDGFNQSIFINGNHNVSTTLQETVLLNSTSDVRIGILDSMAWDWAGKLDEVAIFNRSLSDEEISLLYLRPYGQHYNISDGMILNITFEETSGYFTYDDTTNQVGHLEGFDWATFNYADSQQGSSQVGVYTAEGKYGDAGYFDGVNNMVTLSASALSSLKQNVTVTAWVKKNDLVGEETILSGNLWSVGFNGQLMYMRANGGISPAGNKQTTATPMNDTTDYHFVAYVSNSTNLTFYFDGELVQKFTGSINGTGSTNLFIGGTSSRYFNGSIDELKVFNRALTQQEIIDIMNNNTQTVKNNSRIIFTTQNYTGVNRVNATVPYIESILGTEAYLQHGSWKEIDGYVDDSYLILFPGNSSTNSYNPSYAVTNTGNAYQGSGGKWGNTTFLDGDGDYLDVSGTLPTSNFTISMWVYSSLQGGSGYAPCFADQYDDVTFSGWAFCYDQSSNDYRFWYGNGVDTWSYNNYPQSFNSNQWYSIILVFDGSTVHVYLDNIESITSSHTSTSGQNLLFGASHDEFAGGITSLYNFNYFSGKMDEVMVISKALSTSEVGELYQLGRRKYNYTQQQKVDGVGTYTFNTSLTAIDQSILFNFNTTGFYTAILPKYLNVTYYNVTEEEAPASDTCDCPVSADWIINDGSKCVLSSVCNLATYSLYAVNGELNIATGGTLYTRKVVAYASAKVYTTGSGKVIIS